jgi:bacterioferritin
MTLVLATSRRGSSGASVSADCVSRADRTRLAAGRRRWLPHNGVPQMPWGGMRHRRRHCAVDSVPGLPACPDSDRSAVRSYIRCGQRVLRPRKSVTAGKKDGVSVSPTTNQFEIDVTRIRDEARRHMDQGAVTVGNKIDVGRLIHVLNEVIATEIVCYLRYTQHAIAASGLNRAQVAAEFEEHAREERQHGVWAAERISQLGGDPDFNPATLTQRSHTDYVTVDDSDLKQMLRENLVAERIVITSYQEIIRWIGDADPTSRRLMEKILEEEEEHADDLNDLLGN